MEPSAAPISLGHFGPRAHGAQPAEDVEMLPFIIQETIVFCLLSLVERMCVASNGGIFLPCLH